MQTEAIETPSNFSPGSAKTVYILYLLGLVLGITGIVGVIMAYNDKDKDTPEWYLSHIQFQVRTFWYGLIWMIVGYILTFAIIGIFVLLFWALWLIIRCVKGMKWLDKQEAIPNPTSFFGFGA